MRMVDTLNVSEDAAVSAKIKKYKDLLSKELDIKIGTTSTELDSRKKNCARRRSGHRQFDRRCHA